MYFKDVIGQQTAKQRLIQEVKEQRIPHALLMTGPQGVGKLALAIAYARYICCTNPVDTDSCGECQSCRLFDKLIHPDVHYVFPVIKKKGSSKEFSSDDYINEWREMVLKSPYFNLNDWLAAMKADNQQPLIYVKESNEIIRKLSVKSMMGGYKIVIIWLPEKMNLECSNKLLKVIEEPPSQTVFLMVSDDPSTILPTILSRTQRFNIHSLTETEIANRLLQNGLTETDARTIAHNAEGSYLKAIETLSISEDNEEYFEFFVQLMRLAYMKKVKELKDWSEKIANYGREWQKSFLSYCQRMVREDFIYNFHQPDMVYLNTEEKKFSQNFAPFINERNVIGIMKELNEAALHVERNVNAKMIFFDFALKIIMLLRKK